MPKNESAPKVTVAQARKEIARRALPKGDPKRSVWPAGHITRLSGPELAAIVGPEVAEATPAPAPAKPARKAAAKVQPAPVEVPARDPRKAEAAAMASLVAERGTGPWWVTYRALMAAARSVEVPADEEMAAMWALMNSADTTTV